MPDDLSALEARLDEMVAARLQKQQAEHDAKMAEMEQRLSEAQAGSSRVSQVPLNTVPFHGAGVGEEIAETWGQAQQAVAYAAAGSSLPENPGE